MRITCKFNAVFRPYKVEKVLRASYSRFQEVNTNQKNISGAGLEFLFKTIHEPSINIRFKHFHSHNNTPNPLSSQYNVFRLSA